MSTNASSYQLMILNLISATRTVGFYTSVFIFIPGFFLNLFSLYIFTRKRFWRNTKMGYYYSVHSGLASCLVLMAVFVYLPPDFNFEISSQNVYLCKIVWILRAQFLFGVAYFEVFISVDRTINTVYYNKFQFFNKTRNLVMVTVLIELAIGILNFPAWFRDLKYNYKPNSTEYSVTCVLRSDLLVVNQIESILSRLVPSVANLVMNLIIIRVLFNSRKNVYKGKENKISSKDRQFVVSLIAQNFIFTVLTLPHMLASSMQISAQFSSNSDYISFVSVFFPLGSLFSPVLEAMLFYMNLSFNKLFRSELSEIICSKKKCRNREGELTNQTETKFGDNVV